MGELGGMGGWVDGPRGDVAEVGVFVCNERGFKGGLRFCEVCHCDGGHGSLVMDCLAGW